MWVPTCVPPSAVRDDRLGITHPRSQKCVSDGLAQQRFPGKHSSIVCVCVCGKINHVGHVSHHVSKPMIISPKHVSFSRGFNPAQPTNKDSLGHNNSCACYRSMASRPTLLQLLAVWAPVVSKVAPVLAHGVFFVFTRALVENDSNGCTKGSCSFGRGKRTALLCFT